MESFEYQLSRELGERQEIRIPEQWTSSSIEKRSTDEDVHCSAGNFSTADRLNARLIFSGGANLGGKLFCEVNHLNERC